MAVPQEIFVLVEQQAFRPVPQEIFYFCGTTGKMAVPQEIFVIVERASCPFNIFWKTQN